jgi:hypothetical protein
MKVEVTLRMKTNPAADCKLDLTVGAGESVANLKERVAGLQMIPFPEQDLIYSGVVLKDNAKLAECGVSDAAVLELVVKASDDSLIQQLSELLQARDLSTDELGLLYCYKHGVSVTQALKMLGHDGRLQDFLNDQKKFLLEGGRVTLVREDTGLKPFSVNDEVVRLLKASGGTMEIKALCTKFAQKFNVSLSSLVGARPIEFLAKERALFVVGGHGKVSLKSAVEEEEEKKKRDAPLTFGSSISNQAPKEAAQITSAPPGLDEADWSPEGEQYMELHNRISGRSFNSKAVQILADLITLVYDSIIFDIHHVVKGGSVGKGTAFIGCTDAEVVFFLKGLPPTRHDAWLPPLLKSTFNILSDRLDGKQHVERIEMAEDAVRVCTKEMTLDVRFSPIFETYTETIRILGEHTPDARKFYAASLAKERVQFISRQPSHVKVTMRLLKWWRDQQSWSSKLVCPKDEVLELMAVYSACQTKPADQRMAIANVMSLLSRFNEMRIVWSNYYSKDDVWAPLLRQRPLLMDPTNPFVNVADPQVFNACELMELARTTHFFW